jgi:hypothetical protein
MVIFARSGRTSIAPREIQSIECGMSLGCDMPGIVYRVQKTRKT